MPRTQWDLFEQQPVLLYHPTLSKIPGVGPVYLAGVTKSSQGIWLWSLDYLVSSRMYNTPGSGFPYTPLDDVRMEFDADSGMWLAWRKSDPAFVYRLAQPSETDMADWPNIQRYVPSLENLQQKTEAN